MQPPAWKLSPLAASLALTLALLLLPSPMLCQQQQAKQWDPMFNPMCPRAGDCGLGNSIVSASGQCCPSCSNYTIDGCSPDCLRQNYSSSPCFSACGDAGCMRSKCGEPVDGGSRCCNVSLVKGCPSADKIYVNIDCCPVCYRESGTKPNSPAFCRFNATKGMGQPVCDSLGNCRLGAVNDMRDATNFDFNVINTVCSQSDLATLGHLLTFGGSSILGGGSGGNSGGGGSMGGGSMSGMMNMSMMNMSMMGGGGGGGGGGPTMPPITNLADAKAMLDQLTNFVQNLTKLQDAAQNIQSMTCRDPLVCLAKLLGQVAPALREMLAPVVTIISNLGSSASLASLGSLGSLPDFGSLMANLSMRFNDVVVQGSGCLSLIQTQSPCTAKAQAINMEELIRSCRCDVRNLADFKLLQMLAARIADDAAKNMPPGLSTVASLNCTDLRNPCLVDFINNLIGRTASGCVDANLVNSVRTRMRSLLMTCTGGPQGMTASDLANALATCQLTASDIQSIATLAPEKLQGVLQDGSGVNIGGAPVAGLTVSSLVQKSIINGCPDVKAAIDKVVGQIIDLSMLNASDIPQIINVIKCDQMGRIDAVKWLKLGMQDLADISAKLLNDPDRDAKCQTLVRVCNQSLLANLTACVSKIPPELMRTLFTSGADLQLAAQAFNVSAMTPNDVARSTSVLRDMLSSVTATSDNCLTYMNSLFSFPKERISSSLCLNDTCFKSMCDLMPGHPNTVYCRSMRPAPSLSDMVSLGASVMTQLTAAEVTSAIGSTSDITSFQTLMASFAVPTTSSSSSSGYSDKLNTAKTKTVVGAVMEKFQATFLTGTALNTFSATSVDATILCQMNSEQLSRLPCSQAPTIAYKTGPSYIKTIGRGPGRAISSCVCQSYSGCSNITSTMITQISSYVLFMNETEVGNLPSASLAVYCQSIQSVSISEKCKKMSMAMQAIVHARCVSRVDMSSVGGSNSTDVNSLAVWNTTIVKAVLVCVMTTDQINKMDQDAAEYVVSQLPNCPFNGTWLKVVCNRLFKLYNDSATSGNYSLTTIGMCAVHLGTGIANSTKVNRDDVRSSAGAVSTAFQQVTDACFVRSSNGLQSDCAAAFDSALGAAYQAMINFLTSGNVFGVSRRRKRSVAVLTCTDVQNMASGVAQLTASQIQAMAPSEFQTCFSTFGLTNANWGTDQCTQLKAKTEALYNSTSSWSSSVLLTVGCLTQCWSASDIANIPYSDVAHISDIGKYCSLMPSAAKTAIVSDYIKRTKSNNSAMMTRTDLSSLGYLTCGADPSYVDSFNSTNVLNSLTELGTPGPCDSTVMQSFVNRLKTALGSTVTNWQASYFTSLANLISGLGDTDIPLLSSSQIGYIDASVISGMTVSKFQDFTPSQLTSFSASQRSAVTTAQLAVLSNSQKAALGINIASAAGQLMTNALLVLGCLGASVAGRWFHA